MNVPAGSGSPGHSYGQHRMTIVDRFGVCLCARAILRNLRRNHELAALDLGCGYYATHSRRTLYRYLTKGIGADVRVDAELKLNARLLQDTGPGGQATVESSTVAGYRPRGASHS
jgi:hypothetical protein